MFKHQCKESIENQVRLTEYDAELVQELLRFMYLGKVEQLGTFAPQLLRLADLVRPLTGCFPIITYLFQQVQIRTNKELSYYEILVFSELEILR